MTRATTKPFSVLTGRYPERSLVGFTRATTRSPCPICGAKKHCQVTRDGKLAHCMKESVGAIKRAKDGGYVHVLIEEAFSFNTTRPGAILNSGEHQRQAASVSTPIAPLEIRHAAYEKLIALSPASRYASELVTPAPDGLLARGLLPQDVHRFGALPPLVRERDELARNIDRFIEEQFTAYMETHKLSGVIGVPGFWLKDQSEVKLGKDYNYKRPALVIPYRDERGLIQACQLRFAGRRGGYIWLSTAEDCLDKEPLGTSSGSPVHWTAPPGETISCKDMPILVTEGALKAEAFVRLRPPMRAIATAGVGVAHTEIVRALRGCDALIGFDSDHRENAQVCRQLGRLIAKREQDALLSGYKNNTSIVIWDGVKGIDDAVRANVRLRVLGIAEWLQTLKGKSAEEVADVWRQYDLTPVADEGEQSDLSQKEE
ncbi:MAG: hypothetical protein M3430_05575 [Acidobacteriota bacterium]|nr:hypothetical protein [Acidobacteriota bacterium]